MSASFSAIDEAGVAAMRGIDEELEERFAERLVGRTDEGPAAVEAGEGLELAGPEELDVPALDA